jgi:hypothetical protein
MEHADFRMGIVFGIEAIESKAQSRNMAYSNEVLGGIR